jgi:hypothetical protein
MPAPTRPLRDAFLLATYIVIGAIAFVAFLLLVLPRP